MDEPEAHNRTETEDEKPDVKVIRHTTIRKTPAGMTARLTQWEKYEPRPKQSDSTA